MVKQDAQNLQSTEAHGGSQEGGASIRTAPQATLASPSGEIRYQKQGL